MSRTWSQRLRDWNVAELLDRHPELSIEEMTGDVLVLSGGLGFDATAPDGSAMRDAFEVRIVVPHDMPKRMPQVWDTGRRIPTSFHRLANGSFCLGSPTRLRLAIGRELSIVTFVDRCLVPYLFSYAHFEKHGTMPFGELDHGDKGLIADFETLFRVRSAEACAGMLSLAGRKKRVANRRACPCKSGMRLGSCHHLYVNDVRARLGRAWCRQQAEWITDEYLTDPNTTLNARNRGQPAQKEERPRCHRQHRERHGDCFLAAPDF